MSTRRRHVLITGATGYLGHHCARHFLDQGWRVTTVSRSPQTCDLRACDHHRLDLASRDELAALFRETSPSHCLHLAGPGSIEASYTDPESLVLRVGESTRSLLDSLVGAKASASLLLVSSAAVYGLPPCGAVLEDAPLSPISPYGEAKLLQEQLVEEYVSRYSLEASIARVFSTYGPGLRKLAVWDITRRALRQDRTLRGSGSESRDYLHAIDVAASLERILLAAQPTLRILNVASGQETQITHLARSIYRVLGIDASPRHTGVADRGKPVRLVADIGQLRALGFSPSIDLERGLEETVQWIAAQSRASLA